ncbi:Reverse transcriptase (RNA-dependent DNA polymerase) [Popillia japonica]|uniref:Reverse transcriptase (RNA-dependent DNA polymerase) n=1 Tax=Popillia japonica TaxID=7064 RepID=A0AAW1IXX6_POPJA
MVYLNGTLSTPRNIKHGVAQGSLLGPLIFSLFVNDLPQCISGQVVQYADDTTLLCRGSNDQQLEERGNAMLSEVQYADDTTLLCRGSNDQQLEERGNAMLSEANA